MEEDHTPEMSMQVSLSPLPMFALWVAVTQASYGLAHLVLVALALINILSRLLSTALSTCPGGTGGGLEKGKATAFSVPILSL